MIKVSVVEDQKSIRDTLVLFINRQPDMECISSFSSGEKILDNMVLKRPDVIIMDIDLKEGGGELDGIECMFKTKSLYKGIFVLMYTIFDNDDKLFDALKFGADGYILKRDSVKKLVSAIRDVIEGGAPMSKAIAKKVIESFHVQNSNKTRTDIKLSERQLEILHLLKDGLSNRKIAEQLNITEGTVKQHLFKIYKILQVQNRTEAINKFRERLQP